MIILEGESYVELSQEEEQVINQGSAEAQQQYWQSIPYEEAVDAEIRKRYSPSQEFAILRQRDEKPEEYAAYYAYCEQCKAFVKEQKSMD